MYRHLVNLIVTQQMDKTPLHCAASAEVVDALLKAKSKVDAKDKVSKYEIELCPSPVSMHIKLKV